MAMRIRWSKIAVFALCTAPFAWIVWRAFAQQLGADPVNEITHFTGDWTIRFLLITLAITPVRRLTRQYQLIQFRRMVGLFAFFYGCLHFLTWVVLDKVLALQALGDLHFGSLMQQMGLDIAKRRYITVGMIGLGLMVPLAITSTKGWIRRLGKRWQKLHRLIYFSAIAGVIHYFWLVKADTSLPRLYALIVAGLLGIRIVYWVQQRNRKQRASAPAAGAA
ncbi:MAG TPA: protein-methionine-sulfoxide reductase heme-binding subunit MsrQ [Terriglobales bacterium]|nr:protein-methionine-sulfoxide reductase heme-binding subunit MsrQ [Terriglobales bacterium]